MEMSKFTGQKENTQIEIPEQARYINRREFLKLPLEERRRILAQQAELMLSHYQQDTEWQELETGDLVDY
jgi:acyl-CoA reductase-like NAD-dependent aldehyde dehydrogenase